jgi:hypothetical protein
MKPTNELTSRDLIDLAENLESQLSKVLKKELELPDGPKLGDKFLEVFGLTSDLSFSGKKEATATKNHLEKSIAGIRKLKVEINSLPPRIHWRLSEFGLDAKQGDINNEAFSDGLSREVPFLSNLNSMQTEFEAELGRVNIERELIWKGSGNTFDARARYLAWKVAEIHLYLRGEAPTKMSKRAGDVPSSPYTRAVHRVFELLSVEITFRKPCEHVTNALKAGKPFPNPSPLLSVINDSDFAEHE